MLHSRSIDRCLRPRFPQYSFQPTQVVVTVYSVDPDCTDANPVALGVTAASAALGVSDINFDAPIAATMSTIEAIDASSFRIFCCVDENEKVIALEGSGGELPEEALVEAARRASRDALPFIDVQAQLIDAAGKHKRESGVAHIDAGIIDFARAAGRDALQGVFSDPRVASDKLERGKAVGRVQKDVEVALSSAYPDAPASHMRAAATESVRCAVRARVAGGGRVDGRAFDEVRPILAETGILPIPSSLFSRGETQVLATCTLDEPGSARRVDSEIERGVHADGLNGQFVLNYEFPSFVNNEVGRLMRFNRRQSGHAALAENALRSSVAAVISQGDSETLSMFPYSVRCTADTMSSEGSSSMASVCAASLSLADAGVNERHVAGISVGRIADVMLTDLLGLEDFLGDFDFKVAGTSRGITAAQLDVKSDGLAIDEVQEALQKAKRAKGGILCAMEEACWPPGNNHGELKTNVQLASVKLRGEESPGIFIGRGGEAFPKQERKRCAILMSSREAMARSKSSSRQAMLMRLTAESGISAACLRRTAERQIGAVTRGNGAVVETIAQRKRNSKRQ